jgi:hypothetical protein
MTSIPPLLNRFRLDGFRVKPELTILEYGQNVKQNGWVNNLATANTPGRINGTTQVFAAPVDDDLGVILRGSASEVLPVNGPVFQNRHNEGAGDCPSGGAGRGPNSIVTGVDDPTEVIVAIPMEKVLAASSVATMEESGHDVTSFVFDFDGGPGCFGQID